MLDASIIICTRDRQDALARCLKSVVRAVEVASPLRVEILVVDDGSTDGTADVARRQSAEVSVPLRLISGEGRGLSAARNAGLASAQGEIMVFVDDDCLLSPNHLHEVCRHFATDTSLVLRGGRVELADAEDAPLTIKTSREAARLPIGHHPGGFILGCNMAMRRAVVARVGPFDERFGAGGFLRSAEDTDYLMRAQLCGVELEYVPDMVVFHAHGRRTRAQVARVQRDYSVGDGALTAKHGRRAPWLWRIHYWSARNAVREMLGGPRYDPEWRLSHRRLVLHNLMGAALFMFAKLQRRPAFAMRPPSAMAGCSPSPPHMPPSPEWLGPASWRGVGSHQPAARAVPAPHRS